MARAEKSAKPLKTLKDTATALEASILLCLAKPEKKAVHKLRTNTRRIEAQLELLSMLPELPPHEKQQADARRLLKKIRRAAGQVRDLDVQRDLIENEAAGKNGGTRPTPDLRKEASQLRSNLKRKRDGEADDLRRLLKKHQSALPITFQKLLDVLAPAESLTLTELQLTGLVQDWYTSQTAHPPSAAPLQNEDQLHEIRKQAKLARYLAESAPKSAVRAQRLAAKLEDLQEAGGHWHDWLLLAKISSKELGKSAKLPARFAAHADRSLAAYKRRLSTFAVRPETQHAKAA